MNINTIDLTLLTYEQLFGEQKLEVLKNYGMKMAVTDFSILLGANVSEDCFLSQKTYLKNRTGSYFSSSMNGDYVLKVKETGDLIKEFSLRRFCAGRPAFSYSDHGLNSSIFRNILSHQNKHIEIEYGEYPQTAVTETENEMLENLYITDGLKPTGKVYTTDSRCWDDYDVPFTPLKHEEFEYDSKKYVRVISKSNIHGNGPNKLSNGVLLSNIHNKPVWIEVQRIIWLVDEKSKMLVCKKGIFAGVRFNKRGQYDGNFSNTEIKRFMDNYFVNEMKVVNELQEVTQETSRKKNPYAFDFRKVSEEDIVRGGVESGIAVFLHGPSSEGKSARVKQIDPDLEIIYLRNASPDSLNGKSVYNPDTSEMIDIAPTWYVNLKKKCMDEPNKIHLLFFDELTNALPAIQGMAYNIILDREVNGKWKLPDNARVVAAGNEYSDSLAANQLAEPLFNRFVHVYIKTSVEDWLKWAMTADQKIEKLDYEYTNIERKIHPAIYAYIAYKREGALRTPYTGIKPNADPRKWEMASKLLYKTRQPEMLRGLVGEEITRDFVHFCNQQVITLEDVINGMYDNVELEMSTDEKWATTVGLTSVDEDNVEKVRNFVLRLEPELVSIFDSLWICGDERRIEKITELRLLGEALSYNMEGGICK